MSRYNEIKKIYERLGKIISKYQYGPRLPGTKERDLARKIRIKDTQMRSNLATSLLINKNNHEKTTK